VNLPFQNDESKVLDRRLFEFAFVVSQEELVLSQLLQNQSCNAPMFFDALCEDEDVVEVYTNHAFHDEVLENVVHHCLEGGGRVSESKKHHQWLVEAAISAKYCLPLVTLFHSNILVPPSYVKFREEFRAVKLIHQFGDEGKRIAILDRNGVESCMRQSDLSFFLMKKTGNAMGDFDGRIRPIARFSWMNLSNLTCSFRARG
jgi:hypothetical protein